jgi:hypothetical protein
LESRGRNFVSKRELYFQRTFFAENSLYATFWTDPKKIEEKKLPGTLEPEILIQFGNLVQNRVSQSNKLKNLELAEDPLVDYNKQNYPSVFMETPIFSDKKSTDSQEYPQRLSPKFIISPNEENNNKQVAVNPPERASGGQIKSTGIGVPRDRVTFGYKDISNTTEVTSFDTNQHDQNRMSFHNPFRISESENKHPDSSQPSV